MDGDNIKRKVSSFWTTRPERFQNEEWDHYIKRLRVWIEYRDMKKRGRF